MGSTALKAAFERVGIEPRDVELNIALARYRNKGGTLERLMELARAAYEMASEGLGPGDNHVNRADARQQNEDGGHEHVTDEAKEAMSPSSPQRDGGQGPSAIRSRDASVALVRETSVVTRFRSQDTGTFTAKPQSAGAVAAAGRAATRAALTVLDSYKIRDGRAIGDVRLGELENLRAENAMEASLLRQIQRHGVGDSSARVRDVLKEHELQRMIQRAAEVADAA